MPKPETLTFYIAGMECGACVAMISQSVGEVKGVSDVDISIISGTANISFDPRAASAHQIAQAVTDSFPVHGRPFLATLRLRVPDYAKHDNATKVDAVFAAHKKQVSVETVDRAKGEFIVHFLPLQVDGRKAGPQGWTPGEFLRAISTPAPKGPGLACTIVKEG